MKIQLAVQPLERRLMMAGDVSIRAKKGEIEIKGDNLANVITVAVAANVATITGIGTTLNGVAGPLMFALTRDLEIDLKGGNDVVTITGTLPRELEVEMGDGDDTVNLGTTAALTVADEAEVETDKGNDIVNIGTANFLNELELETGKGNDTVTVTTALNVTREFELDLGKGNDTATLRGTAGKAKLDGDDGNDTLNDGLGANFVVAGKRKVKKFETLA